MKIQGGRVGLTWALGLIVSVVIAAPSELDHQEGVDVAIMTPPELDHQEDVDVAIMTPPELDHQEGVDVAIMTLSELDHQEGVDVALMTPSEPDYQEGVGVSIMTPSELDHQEGVGSPQQENVTALATTERNDKLLVVLLKIQPDMCATNDPVLAMGTCVPAKECTKTSGIASGKCAKGYGVCCIALRSCGSSTSYNNTYFVNPNYSGMDSGAGTCTLTVNRVNSNICQLRLDFLDFDLAQPDADGNCITDFLTITPSSSVPRICGSNDGQHMYVNVDPAGGPIRVTVDRSLSNVTRSWNIKVSQIPCDSPYKAPSGCLQYYTATSGTIYSFNFGPPLPVSSDTRQIANLDYGACVEMADGYCGIIWERNTTSGNSSFTVSDPGPYAPGSADAALFDANCTTDYVIIPGGVTNDGESHDRYCGDSFPDSVTSYMKPFTLYVHQDGSENKTTEGDLGFCLNYRQITDC